jgi:hypothetical protein
MVDHVAAFGGCLQGKLFSLDKERSIEASGGYWELHESLVYFWWNPTEVTEIGKAFSLVLRQESARGFAGYAGPIYNHLHSEHAETVQDEYTRLERTVTFSWSSHRDIGLVGGLEAKLFKHLIVNAEGTYTGDWGLTGEVGWEF